MYIAKILKKDVSNGSVNTVFEKISKKPEILRTDAKKFANKHYNSDGKKKTPFVELKGLKNDLETCGHEGYLFCHESSTVYTEYGSVVWVLDLQIVEIEELT